MPKGAVVKAAKVMPFSPAKLKDQYLSRMLLDDESFGSKTMQLNHCTLKPGGVVPVSSHRPPYDEVYYLLRGRGVVHLDGVDHQVRGDTLIFIPGGTDHGVTNTSETEDLVWLTVWAGVAEEGVNPIYDMRKKAWGTTYREV